jgi:7-carboxy-7-deazaguanine synthase
VQINHQPREKRDLSGDGSLQVHSIFLTIQGEGPFCGTPCVFVRLAGCNLQCPACDTDYTSIRRTMGPGEILAEVNELWRKDRWRPGLVVVTGGEPFRQDLYGLFSMLTGNGYYVQVESNGTLDPGPWRYQTSVHLDNREGVYVVCSPKTGSLNKRIFDVACALKYVVRFNDIEPDGLPRHALDHPSNPYPARPPEGWDRPIYIQPLDEQDETANALNTRTAVILAIKHGYTLQLQVHKLIGVE